MFYSVSTMVKDFSVSRLCDAYGALLTEHGREMLRSYYDDDLSLSEIAENCGITRQAVLCGIRRAENQLRDCESKLHCIERRDAAMGLLDELRAQPVGERAQAILDRLADLV